MPRTGSKKWLARANSGNDIFVRNHRLAVSRSAMARVVLFDVQDDFRHEAACFLAGCDFEVSSTGNCAEFLASVAAVDLVIFDFALADGAGLELVKNLRGQYPHLGIIILTARGAIEDKLQALYAGADHYLLKPVQLPELQAVVEALARRVGGAAAWQLRVSLRLLQAPEGQQGTLSAAELAIFRLFAVHAGAVISRRQIVEAMGYSWLEYDLRRLDTLISRLRRRWREQLGLELPLRTEHRDGYSFCAPLRCAG